MVDFTKEQAFINLKGLIRKYNENKLDKGFASNESQISESLIKPFVNLVLGYDTSDPSEFKVQSSMGGKRSDMLVCLNGVTQFIIEAKALSHDIRKDYQYYQQAIYYAHTKEKKFAILTNFKHFIILDAEIEKEPLKAEVALIDIEKYEENFDILWAFSKEVWQEKGEDNEILLKLKGKKKQKIDEQLLDDLKRWRESLLNSLKKHLQKNKYDFDKDIGEIEEEVQKFIDRLVFICYCEDKKLMDVELNPIINDKDRFWDKEWYALGRVRKLFEVYFQKYNSDLFNESWCDKFYFDDNTLLKVLKDLRQPQGKQPYDFSIIEADILGKAYENFIGHVLTGQKRFKEKESKGKRKSEGIYYTPTYIVDYIVRNTVSEYIKGKSIASINKVKILDPACGSGSFLIKAFDALVEECEKIRKLSYEEKKDLMLNCIFGVDKDERAVEICKLNLSLKLAETGKKLPELYNNIKCGDSLIDDKNIAGDKAFNWNEKFKFIMDNGGFDVVIGNPPYVKEFVNRKIFEEVKEGSSRVLKYYEGKMDYLYFFIELGIDLLKNNGYLSFITTNYWLQAEGAKKLREKILKETTLISVFNFNEFKVFERTGQHNLTLILKKQENENNKIRISIIKDKPISKNEVIGALNDININKKIERFVSQAQKEFLQNDDFKIAFVSDKIKKILEKIKSQQNYFLNEGNVAQGIVAPQESVISSHLRYLPNRNIGDGIFTISNKELQKLNLNSKEKELIKPFFTSDNIGKYFASDKNNKWIIYTNTKVIKEIDDYQHIKKHLEQFKKVITSDFGPYGLHRAREERFFLGEKILCLRKTKYPAFSYVDFPCYVTQTFFIIQPKDINLKYLTTILNSKVTHFWLYFKGKREGNQLQIDKAPILTIPIKLISESQQLPFIKLADKMLSLNKKLQEIGDKNTLEKQKIQEEIKKTDNEIDELVYQLYEITKEEKKIIEESLK